MNPILRESVAKGVFLGLWSYLAIIQPDAATFIRVLTWGVVGLILGLIGGAVQQFSRGFRPGRNFVGFLMLTVLDSPYFIYLGTIGGFALGLFTQTDAPAATIAPDLLGAAAGGAAYIVSPPGREWLGYCALGGALLGYGFHQLREIKDWFTRILLGGIVAGLLMVVAVTYVPQIPALAGLSEQFRFGVYLLAGLPFFYMLTFCGESEESEVEIGAICAAAGIGLYLLRLESKLPETFDKLILLVPLAFYYVYSTRWLPGLRVFKHNLRGYGFLSLGRTRDSLLSFSRALVLDRKNSLASDGLTKLIRGLDVSKVDDQTAKLLPVAFCLDAVSQKLVGERPPTEPERIEALRMLDLLRTQRPDASPRIDYLRAVAFTHAKDFDRAAETLSGVLDPHTETPEAARRGVLVPAWDLATRLHPELVKRLGEAELNKPGRRLDAIAAVEAILAQAPTDPVAVGLKRELYAGLTEAEFIASTAGTAPGNERFHYEYVEQLGRALLADSDPAQVERGMAYLRLAARADPMRAMQIFKDLTDTALSQSRGEEAAGYLGQIKRIGMNVGPARLPADAKAVYVAAVKKLADDAAARKDYAGAVDDFRLYLEATQEEPNALRKLAEWYVLAGDPLNALLIVERGLLYAKADADLLAKKDSYYFSVDPEQVARVKDKISGWFDVAYLFKKSKAIVEQREVDLDTVDYGLHLVRLGRIFQPQAQVGMVTEARLLLRRGERDAGLKLLEDLRELPRGSGNDEEDAWFLAVRMLGEMYLDELQRPDLAVNCFSVYREYQKSGADTLFSLGRAHEAAGNANAAIKAYEAIDMYANHPRRYEASEAVRRLKGL